MRCAHDGCLCPTEVDGTYCGEYCERHSGMDDHESHSCDCGHAACAGNPS